jgi:hypothetical protein
MSQMGYVYLGYAVCFGGLTAYALRVVLRARKLSSALPPRERTWR